MWRGIDERRCERAAANHAHSLRLAGPDEVKVDRRVIDREFMNRHTVRPAKYTDRVSVEGGRVSLVRINGSRERRRVEWKAPPSSACTRRRR